MSKTLVSIVSRHNVPNYLFIKHMSKNDIKKHIFVSTQKMAENEKWLADSVGADNIEALQSIKLIDEDDYAANVKALETAIAPEADEEFVVNLTGGTKGMSLAVHFVFSKFNSKFFTVTQNSSNVYDFQVGCRKKLTETISLEKYLALYGISIQSKGVPSKEEDANNIFRQLAAKGFDKNKVEMLKNAHEHKNPQIKSYRSGGWFENFSYFKIKRDYDIPDEAIAQGVKVVKSTSTAISDEVKGANNDNEIDVLFVKDNTLYTVECKVGLDKKEIGECEYKAAAIAQYLGFQVKSYIFWLNDISYCSKDLDNIRKRSKYLQMSGIVTGEGLQGDGKGYLEKPNIC